MTYPEEPTPGQPLTATWGRKVVRCLRAVTPLPGPGATYEQKANGTMIGVLRQKLSSGGVSYGHTEILPFRLGVGTETIEYYGETGIRFHKVAIMPAVDIDGVGYYVLNNTVDSDDKLIGLPMPKEGSGLPWVWIKDDELEDITEEAEDRTTTETYLHIDRNNKVCTLANSETIPDTEVTIDDGTQSGKTITFHSDEWYIIGSFDLPEDENGHYDATKKPQVLGQYVIGALVWKNGEVEQKPYPFQLRVVEVPTERDPSVTVSHIIVYCPTVDKDGTLSGIDNDEFVNDDLGYPEGSGWYEIYYDPEIPQEDFYIDCYAKVIEGELWATVGYFEEEPEEYAGGMKFVVGAAGLQDDKWIVENAVVGSVVWTENNYADHPFKLKWENDGTEESPDWKALVYLPSGCVQWNGDSSTTGVVCANTKKGTSDWYYVDEETDGSTDTVYLNGYHYYKGSGETIESVGFAFIITNKKTKAPGTWGEGWTQHSQYLYSIALAKIDSNDNFINSVTSAIALDRNVYYYIGKPHGGGGGGGGGTTVTIQDNREDKSKEGIVVFDVTGPSGEIPLIVENFIGSDLVLVEIDEQQNKKTLDDYLLETNIDKDNFEEVLGPTITPDEEESRATGEPLPAAPSYHTHQITQLADAEGTPLTDSETGPETVRDWLEELGIVTSGGMVGPTGEDEVDPVVSESSINFGDASIIKHDAETASPGGGGEDGGLLALADHVHPLNLVEMDAATGPTGATAPEPPAPNQYVKPVGSALGPTGPSGEQQADPALASFGTDPHYARVDHVHPQQPGAGPGLKTTPQPTHGISIIPDFTKADDTNLDRDEDKMYDDITGKDNTTPAGWERGKTAYRNGHVVDKDHPAVGCSVTVCTHSYLWGRGTTADPQRTVNFFSRLDFDENGLLVRVVPCDHWHRDKL